MGIGIGRVQVQMGLGLRARYPESFPARSANGADRTAADNVPSKSRSIDGSQFTCAAGGGVKTGVHHLGIFMVRVLPSVYVTYSRLRPTDFSERLNGSPLEQTSPPPSRCA